MGNQVLIILALHRCSSELLAVLQIILPVNFILAMKKDIFNPVIFAAPKRKVDLPFIEEKIVMHN
jgi:hypothetical protein